MRSLVVQNGTLDQSPPLTAAQPDLTADSSAEAAESRDACSNTTTAENGHYAVITDEKALSELVDACRSKGLFAFDTETDSLDCITANLVGFSLSHSPCEAFYIPLQSPDSPTITKAAVQRQLMRLFEPGVTVIGHNLKFDIHVMLRIGVRVACSLFDTMIAAWVLDSDSNSFSLESLSERLLGISGLNYEDVVPKGKTFESVPIATAVQYASEDADFAYRLYCQLRIALETEKTYTSLFRARDAAHSHPCNHGRERDCG